MEAETQQTEEQPSFMWDFISKTFKMFLISMIVRFLLGSFLGYSNNSQPSNKTTTNQQLPYNSMYKSGTEFVN